MARPGRAAAERLTLHGVIVLTALVQIAIVPLLPTLSRTYHLGTTEAGLLLAAPSLGMLVTSLPVGRVADRFGYRQVTLAATALLAVAAALQAAPSLSLLLAGRVLFGVAYGAVWTTGPSWLSALAATGQGGAGPGTIVTSSAVGSTVGPVVAGVLAQHLGVRYPFLLITALAVLLCLALGAVVAGSRPPGSVMPPQAQAVRWRDVGAVAWRSPGIVGAAIAMLVVGGVGGVTQLLVPLQLHRSGSTDAGIGALFSLTGVVYVLVSAGAVRLGGRLVSARSTAWGCGLVALVLLPAAAGRATALMVVTVLAFTVARAALNTIAYPLAAQDPHTPQAGPGAVLGLLNAAWAASTLLAPLLAGWLAGVGGIRLAYLVTAVGAAGWALLIAGRLRIRRPAPARALASIG